MLYIQECISVISVDIKRYTDFVRMHMSQDLSTVRVNAVVVRSAQDYNTSGTTPGSATQAEALVELRDRSCRCLLGYSYQTTLTAAVVMYNNYD